jgi:hypothetical protein
MVKHFAQLERDGLIERWDGREIDAGEDWAGKIDARLEAADIVLLLVSPTAMTSRCGARWSAMRPGRRTSFP